MDADITILGGLPVSISFKFDSPDPVVGYDGGACEWEITHINNRKCKKPPQWLYNRIDKCKNEETRIIEKLNEVGDSLGYDYYEDF